MRVLLLWSVAIRAEASCWRSNPTLPLFVFAWGKLLKNGFMDDSVGGVQKQRLSIRLFCMSRPRFPYGDKRGRFRDYFSKSFTKAGRDSSGSMLGPSLKALSGSGCVSKK